jgi:hypothetical protein
MEVRFGETCCGLLAFALRSPRTPFLANNALCPGRNWHCANVLSFADQVGNHPVLLADLKIFQSESYQPRTSQATPNEQR